MRLMFALSFGLVAAACTTETLSTSPGAMPAPAPTAQMAFAPASDDMGAAINGARASAGKAALAPRPALMAAAQAHADDMARRGYFSHTGANGSDVGQRIRAQGCNWTGAAENIAQGQRTAGEVVAAWSGSRGHAANMMGNYTGYGVGQAGGIWVVTFAAGC